MKPNLRLWFTAFWGTFDKYDNIFVYALKQKYSVTVTPDNPDLVITDNPYQRYQNAKMVYFSGEPFFDIGLCDCALTQFNVDKKNYFRLPLYLLYAYDYFKHGIVSSLEEFFQTKYCKKDKQKFCAYISRGPGQTDMREKLFNKLSSYKRIDSPGSHFNNVPSIGGESGTIHGSIEKVKFISDYKFTFAIENTDSYNGKRGYTTEKIVEPFFAGSIPIYWGNPKITNDFNSESFLSFYQYGTIDKLVERIIEIDNDDKLYSDYISQPIIKNVELFSIDYLVQIFETILE